MPSDRTIRRYNLWRWALYGALFSVAVRALSTENFFLPSTAAGMARLIGNLLAGIIIFVLIAYFNNLRIDRKNEQQEREQTRKLDDWSDAEKEGFRNQMNKPRD